MKPGILADLRDMLAVAALLVIVLAVSQGPNNPLVRAVILVVGRSFDAVFR